MQSSHITNTGKPEEQPQYPTTALEFLEGFGIQRNGVQSDVAELETVAASSVAAVRSGVHTAVTQFSNVFQTMYNMAMQASAAPASSATAPNTARASTAAPATVVGAGWISILQASENDYNQEDDMDDEEAYKEARRHGPSNAQIP